MNCGAHGTAALSPNGPYYEDDTVTLTLTPEGGYRVKRVTGLPEGFTKSNNVYTLPMNGSDLTISVEFELNPTVTVNFARFPGAGGSVTGVKNEVTGEITATGTPSDGYTFLYWMDYEALTALSSENPYTFAPDHNMTLVGHFGYIYPAGGGTVQTQVERDGTVTVTAKPAAGYSFLFWMDLGTQEVVTYDVSYNFTPNTTQALAAAFQQGTRRLYLYKQTSEEGSFRVVNSQAYYAPGDTVELEATPAEGYALDDFGIAKYESGATTVHFDPVGGNSFTMPDYDVIVSAFYIRLYQVTVAAFPAEGGAVSGGGSYREGESVTVTAAAKAGYRFVNWTENGAQVAAEDTYTFTAGADRSLTAHFTTETVTYPLWVSGVQVTSGNAADILGNGTAKFEGNAASGTLTLTDANITGAYSRANIYTSGMDLTVSAVGVNNLSGTLVAIRAESGNLTVCGGSIVVDSSSNGVYSTGSLTVQDADLKVTTANYGINSDSWLTIRNSRVEVHTSGYAIYSDKTLSIENSDILAETSMYYSINAEGVLTITNSKVSSTAAGCAIWGDSITLGEGLAIFDPEGGYINGSRIFDANGNVAAHVFIDKPVPYVDAEGNAQELRQASFCCGLCDHPGHHGLHQRRHQAL